MAQKQFTNYQDSILSFNLREAMLGILKPGRYCGFDSYSHLSTGGGIINITIGHSSSGITVANKAYPTPALSGNKGVLLTTQGGIIHEDDTTVDIAIDDGSANGGSDRYDVIYAQHTFLDGTPGSNPATYGIKKGTPGAGTPTLDYLSKQVRLALVRIPNGAITYGALTITPITAPELGDLTIGTWALSYIGTRTYTEQNYVTNAQSLTSSVDALDMKVKDHTDDLALLNSKKLDDMATPDDNTDLDASITRHGLLKKLSNVSTQFMNGVGAWANPMGSKLIWDTNQTTVWDQTGLNIPATSSGDIDMSGVVPSGTTVVLLNVHIAIGTAGESGVLYLNKKGQTTSLGARIKSVFVDNNTEDDLLIEADAMVLIAVDVDRKISWAYSHTGGPNPITLTIRLMGWQVDA